MSKRYTFFIHMNATKEWTSLTEAERNSYFTETLKGIFLTYPSVLVRLYDAEAFSAKCTDIAVCETEILEDYNLLVEDLRNSEMFSVPYFEVVDVFPTIEDDFKSITSE